MAVAVLLSFFGQSQAQEAAGQPNVENTRAPEEAPTFAAETPGEEEFDDDKIIVKLEDGATQRDLRDLNSQNDARVEEDLPQDLELIDLPRDLPVEAAVRRYERSPDVEYAEPDFLLRPAVTSPNDPYYPQLYGLDNTGQNTGTPDADVDGPEAWNGTTGSQESLVAVIDTGVDINHPDLKNNIWVNADEVPNNGRDDDNNGYVDDVHGWDFYNGNKSVYDPDRSGEGDEHGTHVAGTIAAEGNNGEGVAGVSWQARVMVLKFLGPNGGYTSDAVRAIDYAVANGAKISNNSWGGGGRSQALKDAITRADAKGHLFVAAAGNSGVNNDNEPHYPAAYDNDNIISVAATDNNDGLAEFSNFGSDAVDLGAPGVRILSTVPGERYAYYSGTSMAAPHVTGVAALVDGQSETAGDEDLKAEVLDSVDRVSALRTRTRTGGRLNAAGAVGAQPSTITKASLSTSRNVVRFGSRVSLGGRLTTFSGRAVAGERIIFVHRPAGQSRFTSIAETTTASDGRFSLGGVRPEKNTEYRARFAGGTDGVADAQSAGRRVLVQPRITLNTSTRTLKVRKARILSGRIAPRHGGYVRVEIRRNGKRVQTRKVSLNDSGYRFRYRAKRPGRYSFRAVYPSHKDHAMGASPTRKFRVVR